MTWLIRTSAVRSSTRQRLAAGVDGAGVHRQLGAGLGEQFDEPGDRQWHPVGVDAALEAGRCLRPQAEAGDGLRDPDRLEPGHLERDDASWRR